MRAEELKEYLEIVVDMEKELYLQEKTMQELKSKIESLGHTKHFDKPYVPSEPKEPDNSRDKKKALKWFVIVFLGIFLLGGIWGLIFGPIVAGLVAGLVYLDNSSNRNKKKKEYQHSLDNYRNDMIRYQTQMSEYQTNIAEDQKRVEHEIAAKNYFVAELDRLNEQNTKSKETLSKIYAKNIIFPKYRNLPAVCSLYEYLSAGRCSTLDGHEGAYNILEMEIRLDHVVLQLDQIISKLDSIQRSQYMVYSAIQNANQKSARLLDAVYHMSDSLESLGAQSTNLSSQISELQKTSALTAYHTEQAQKELSYMNHMDYLSGRNDDVLFNLPPQ